MQCIGTVAQAGQDLARVTDLLVQHIVDTWRRLPARKYEDAACTVGQARQPRVHADRADFLQLHPSHFIKTLVFETDSEPVAFLILGDREDNEVKLKNLVDCQHLQLASGNIKVMVEGLKRARAESYELTAGCLTARVRVLASETPRGASVVQYMAQLTELFKEYAKLSHHLSADGVVASLQQQDVDQFADLLAAHLSQPTAEKQRLLEITQPLERLQSLNDLLDVEIDPKTLQPRPLATIGVRWIWDLVRSWDLVKWIPDALLRRAIEEMLVTEIQQVIYESKRGQKLLDEHNDCAMRNAAQAVDACRGEVTEQFENILLRNDLGSEFLKATIRERLGEWIERNIQRRLL